jgi:hypothetical protein
MDKKYALMHDGLEVCVDTLNILRCLNTQEAENTNYGNTAHFSRMVSIMLSLNSQRQSQQTALLSQKGRRTV